MSLNPALHDEVINSPIERANPLNNPDEKVIQGYNKFDLTHQSALSTRFGEVTPFHVFEVLPKDRHLVHDAGLTLLNSIDASMVSTVNEYHDYFYVPMRSCFPINYEKMIVNPTKGSDLPLDALPMIPLCAFIKRLLTNSETVLVNGGTVTSVVPSAVAPSVDEAGNLVLINRYLYAAYMLSRGQLLDYLGFCLDSIGSGSLGSYFSSTIYKNDFQSYIDTIFENLIADYYIDEDGVETDSVIPVGLAAYDLAELTTYSGTSVQTSISTNSLTGRKIYYNPAYNPETDVDEWTLSGFRGALYDALENGYFIVPFVREGNGLGNSIRPAFYEACSRFRDYFSQFDFPTLNLNTTPEEYFDSGCINPMRIIAYQQIIAEYYTNDSIDNVFNSDLWMQNVRSIMFPSNSYSFSTERTFEYNGVDMEYDLFTTGSFNLAFFTMNNQQGLLSRMLPFISSVFSLRRSLRYGDMFATGRPDFLSVGQLGIPVDSENMVDPVEVTQQLVMARMKQATNWMGQKFEAQMDGLYDARPSDTGPHPYFITHRKVVLGRDQVLNTADKQGKRVTNLVGKSDSTGIDILLDDFGVALGLLSFDCLPLYPAGIDRNFRNCDRYTMFNSMLQNVGDQDLRLDELTGDVRYSRQTFAYLPRYAQYKFAISRAHGAFAGNLHQDVMALRYPSRQFMHDGRVSLVINPDFIRDRPLYFDQFYISRQSLSPANYYHFLSSFNMTHVAARRMQLVPQLLF